MKTRSAAYRRHRPRRGPAILLCAALAVGSALTTAGTSSAAAQIDQVGFPTFKGDPDPVPQVPAAYTPGNQLRDIFDADVAAGAGTDTDHDFWIDKMLTRKGTAGDSDPGNSDNNEYLFSRGRAVFMKTHDPAVLGFGGQVAYWEAIDGREAYDITLKADGKPLTLTEDTAARKQTPSYWKERFTTSDHDLAVTEVKFVTANDVAVTEFSVANSGSAARTVSITATSPYTTVADGTELTGTVPALNHLTTLHPRFSGDDVTPDQGALTGSLTVPAGGQAGTKVQLGFLADEIPASRTEYDQVRKAAPAAAYRASVTAYNKWWADNIPYLDVPDKNIEKSLYYRWWLMRFNYLDAEIPGDDYPFPTSVEGALGYNNAIDLTLPLFLDDLKYFRDPAYSYGPWVTAGQVQAPNGQFVDNPGDPANWSASHAQYISASAWRSYQLHGGPASIAEQLGRYAQNDVDGQLAAMDSDNDGVLDTNWNSWTGNDADAVSFDYAPGHRLDRPESAFTWAGAMAAVQAYTLSGDTGKAAAMQATADRMRTGLLDNLWDPASKSLLSKDVVTGKLDPWKEINNYDPYTVGMIPTPDGTATDDSYVEALRYFADKDEFPIFPFYTANQKDKAAAAAAGRPGSNNFSFINSTGLLNLYASAIRRYPSSYITPESFSKLLSWNAWANYADSGDNRYPDATEFFADGSADPGSIGYRSWIHQTILGATNHNVIEDVMGLQSRSDAKIELWPIDIGWDHFAANNIAYRNADVSITWDKPGDGRTYYGKGVPEGLTIWVNGKQAATVDSLSHLVYDPKDGSVTFPDGTGGQVTHHSATQVDAPQQVSYDATSRVASIFAATGNDITSADKHLTNLAQGATATASYSASGHGPSAVVDGSTAINPYWGDAGSPNDRDTLELDLPAAQPISDLKAFFHSDKKTDGYAEPATFTVQYDDHGTWRTVTDQSRTPVDPVAGYDDVRFTEVTTAKIRLTLTPLDGHAVAVKEVQLFDPHPAVHGQPNAAPHVEAYLDDTATSAGQAHLTGLVKDDGQPSAEVGRQWSVVSAPSGGAAVIASPTHSSTLVRFSEAGDYTLRLTATDGALSASQDVHVAATSAAGQANVAAGATPTADYTAPWDSINAVNDGKVINSGGASTDYWGTWTGDDPATRTLQYTWKSPVRISGSDIAFWHDSPAGGGSGVAVPKSWTMQYLAADGTTWTDIPDPSGYGTSDTGTNTTTFRPVTTTAVRAVFTADTNGTSHAAVGVSEWRILASPPESVADTEVRTTVGTLPKLPATVDLVYDDGTRAPAAVSWQAVTADQVAQDGSRFTVTGITDAGSVAQATVWVRASLGTTITSLQAVDVHTPVGTAPQLPGTITAVYNDGTMDSAIPVTWEAVPPASYASAGQFTVHGTVPGTGFTAVATVTVKAPS